MIIAPLEDKYPKEATDEPWMNKQATILALTYMSASAVHRFFDHH